MYRLPEAAQRRQTKQATIIEVGASIAAYLVSYAVLSDPWACLTWLGACAIIIAVHKEG